MTTSAQNTHSPAEDYIFRRGVVAAIAGMLLLLEGAAWGSWLLPESHLQRCVLSGVVCALAVGLPYLMMRQSPETASFDGRWLGGGVRPWLFVFPFTAILIAMNVIIHQLATILFGWYFPGARDLPAMFTPEISTHRLPLCAAPCSMHCVSWRGWMKYLMSIARHSTRDF